jgi:hypothetical protein
MIYLLLFFLLIVFLWLVSLKKRKVKPIAMPKRHPVSKKAAAAKVVYPIFIPFYQWHGYINGLGWRKRNEFVEKGILKKSRL